ncbi:MAG: 4-alpha-glucanotransferase [Gammaproteobacteria bacterium]|nr:4-alpha-glucanotransferase [Gammaproteobacteria bacterium]
MSAAGGGVAADLEQLRQGVDGEALQALCKRHGVHDGFHDIWGQYHPASDTLKRALLGVLLGSARESGTQVTESQGSAPLSLSRPAVVAAAHGPVRVDLIVAAHAGPDLSWSVLLESGERRHGRLLRRAEGEGWQVEGDGLRLAEHGQTAGCDLLTLEIDLDLPPGYHSLGVLDSHAVGADSAHPFAVHAELICTPERCQAVPRVPREQGGERRLWGVSVQLYGLRSARNWGIGDFGDLRVAIEQAARLGADSLGLNPLHAIQTLEPGLGSPYSPASRQFLNVLYLDVEAIPEFGQSEDAQRLVESSEFRNRLQALRERTLVDYDEVARLKLRVLAPLYEAFRQQHLDIGTERADAFRRFQRSQGRALRQHALFEALQGELGGMHSDALGEVPTSGRICGWPVWPEAYRDPESEHTRRFEQTQPARIEYYEYLQWCAHQQLLEAQQLARSSGMRLGLYLDLALGNDTGGPEVWAGQRSFALGASVGAPPDDLSPAGQDWGIAVYNPSCFARDGYAPFIRVLRAQMAVAGAVRIDHVMGLMRQYWIVQTEQGKQGGYVSFPFEDLLGIVALESERNRCVVIGEDLGTVPDEVRTRLSARGVLSYRVLYFEKHWHEGGAFKTPGEYPEQALAVATTHDLPTLRGFWLGRDLDARAAIGDGAGGFPDAAIRDRLYAERDADRHRLHAMLSEQGLAPGDAAFSHGGRPPAMLSEAVHRFLARTPCALTMVQMEDVLGQEEQTNLPGTTDEHANWCRKLSLPLEQWPGHAPLEALSAMMQSER